MIFDCIISLDLTLNLLSMFDRVLQLGFGGILTLIWWVMLGDSEPKLILLLYQGTRKQNGFGFGARTIGITNFIGSVFQALTRLYVSSRFPNEVPSQKLYSNTSVLISIVLVLFTFIDSIVEVSKLNLLVMFLIGKYLILPLQMLLFHKKAKEYFLVEHQKYYQFFQIFFQMLKSKFTPSNQINPSPSSLTTSSPDVAPQIESEPNSLQLEARRKHAEKLLELRIWSPWIRSRSVPRIINFNPKPPKRNKSVNNINDVYRIDYHYKKFVMSKPKPKPKPINPFDSNKKSNSGMTSIEIHD